MGWGGGGGGCEDKCGIREQQVPTLDWLMSERRDLECSFLSSLSLSLSRQLLSLTFSQVPFSVLDDDSVGVFSYLLTHLLYWLKSLLTESTVEAMKRCSF